jgi:hypothetical protein
LTLGRSGKAADQSSGTLNVRPKEKDLPHMRIRRSGLGVQIVPVVPADDQAKVGDGCELGCPRADHCAYLATRDGKPALVALFRAEVSREDQMSALAEFLQQGRIQACNVARVGDHDDGPPARCQRGTNGNGDLVWPVSPWQGGPHRSRSTTIRQGA